MTVLEDHPTGGMVDTIQREIVEDYRLDEIEFCAGDVVLDIGAHVGAVSIHLATRNPDIVVYAFEPVRENYDRLVRNLRAQSVTNVQPIPLAVSGDGRRMRLGGDLAANSGSATAYGSAAGEMIVASIAFPDIFVEHYIDRCRLLKIDVEGAEYEIFESAGRWLDRIDFIRGEFHSNRTLTSLGYDPLILADRLGARRISGELSEGRLGLTGARSADDRVRVNLCAMAE